MKIDILELSKVQDKVIGRYFDKTDTLQVEDVLRDASIEITKAQTEILYKYYKTKNSWKDGIDKDFAIKHLQTIIKYICGIVYILDSDLPDEDVLDEYVEEEMEQLSRSDVVLTMFNMMNRVSELVLVFWITEDDGGSMEEEEIFCICMEILDGINIMCEAFNISQEEILAGINK